MFTGIIHTSGVIETLDKLEAGARLRIRAIRVRTWCDKDSAFVAIGDTDEDGFKRVFFELKSPIRAQIHMPAGIRLRRLASMNVLRASSTRQPNGP